MIYRQLKTNCDCVAEIFVTQEHFVINVFVKKPTKPQKKEKSVFPGNILLSCKKQKLQWKSLFSPQKYSHLQITIFGSFLL